MADDNDKGINNDNVVRGPWKRVKTVNQAKTNKITEDMGFSDEVAESVMYRTMNYPHPMTALVNNLMLTKTESIEDVYARFDHEKLEKMVSVLSDDKKDDE